jgi:Hint domain-containing protein
MEQTRRDVMRRNLFRAGVGLTTAVAAKVLTHRAQAAPSLPPQSNALPPQSRGSPQGGSFAGCFLRGTPILTIEGEKPIEELQINERLEVFLAGIAPVESIVQWRGAVTPIRIKAGAIDAGQPYSDLVITEDHAILFDGSLIAAGNLVNGTTILREPRRESEFFHIQLEGHDVIYALGVACESFYNEADEEPCLPRFRYRGRRHEAIGYLRSALSPVVDLRNHADQIRDRLDLAA